MADADSQASSRLFISYRREDSSGHVLALLPALRRHFGADRIFKDTDNIPPGADFQKFIKRELESCSVLLAIIGRDWLTIQDARVGHRRLDNPDDFLRVEVASALRNERIRVIPVLVERATMPAPEDLPPDLAELPYRNAVELSDTRWESDVQLLIKAVEEASADAASKPQTDQRPELVDLHKRRAREIAVQLSAARAALDAQDYEGALWACEKALLLDPHHSEALQLLDRARRSLDEQKIETALGKARQALVRREIGEASDFIDQALAIDNTSPAALTLRKEMLALRRERERERERARVAQSATERARASFEEQDFEAAVRHADDALAVEPAAAEPQDIRSKALAALDDRRRQREGKRRAQQAVTDARERFAAGEYEAALQMLGAFSPAHPLVSAALQELQTAFEQVQQGTRQVDELVRRAAEALAANRYQDAISRLNEAAATAPDRADVAALLDKARARQSAAAAADEARRRADARLSEASKKVDQQDYLAARELVEAAGRDDPQHPEIEPWRRRIDRALADRAAVARRAEAVARALDGAKQSFTKGDLESAVRQADAALRLDPGLEDAHALRDEARAALAERRSREEHERSVRETIALARRMFDANEHRRAIGLLEELRPPHALVAEALDRLRGELRTLEQRRRQAEEEARQRQEREREASERIRAEAILDILARAQKRLIDEDFAHALADADEVLHLDPDALPARDLRAAAAAGLQRQIERKAEERRAEEAAEQARAEAARAAEERRRADARAMAATQGWRAGIRGVRGLGAAAILIIIASIGIYYSALTPASPSPPEATTPSTGPAAPPRSKPIEAPASLPDTSPPPKVAVPESKAPPDPPPTSNVSTKEAATRHKLELLRTTALQQQRSGQREAALNTATAGLQLQPKDPALERVMDSLLSQAQGAAQRAHEKAGNAGAVTFAQKTFSDAVRLEDEATRSREAGRKGTAIQSFWNAEARFELAAREAANEQSRLNQEAARAKQKEIDEQQQTRTPDPPKDPVKDTARDASQNPAPPIDRIEQEKARIDATLRRLESAYDRLDAAGVRAVFPGAPDSLGRTFAQYEFYRLEMVVERIDVSADATSATAICRLSHYFKPKGAREQQQKTQPQYTLQKRGDAWIILQQRF